MELPDPSFDSLPSLTGLMQGTGVTAPVFGDLTPGELVRPEHPSYFGYMRSVVIDSLHYLLWGDGREQFFDMQADPFELKPLTIDTIGLEPFRRFLGAAGAQ